jgi:hypothetical protein
VGSDGVLIRTHDADNNTPSDQAGLASGGGNGRIYCIAED